MPTARDPRRRLRHALAVAAWLAGASASAGHETPVPGDRSGVVVPAIEHGAMAVFDRYRTAILSLARSAPGGDPDLAALLLFQATQEADCLWLMLPGSVGDETNPLNLCAHAETASLKAILETLRGQADPTGAEARGLVSRIDADMVMIGTSYRLCIHSGEAFNTASPIRPDPVALAGHVARRYGVFLAAGMALVLIAGTAVRRRAAVRPRAER